MTTLPHHALTHRQSNIQLRHSSFLDFAAHYPRLHPGGSPIPASEEILLLFTMYLAYRIEPPSCKVYLYAVRTCILRTGFPTLWKTACNCRGLREESNKPTLLHQTTTSQLPQPSSAYSIATQLHLL